MPLCVKVNPIIDLDFILIKWYIKYVLQGDRNYLETPLSWLSESCEDTSHKHIGKLMLYFYGILLIRRSREFYYLKKKYDKVINNWRDFINFRVTYKWLQTNSWF